MSYCNDINCGYYWQDEEEDFPTCHFEGGWTAPCEEEPYDDEEN